MAIFANAYATVSVPLILKKKSIASYLSDYSSMKSNLTKKRKKDIGNK